MDNKKHTFQLAAHENVTSLLDLQSNAVGEYEEGDDPGDENEIKIGRPTHDGKQRKHRSQQTRCDPRHDQL